MKASIGHVCYRLLPLTVFLSVWQLVGSQVPGADFFFSTPWAVLRTAAEMIVIDGTNLWAVARLDEPTTFPADGLLWNMALTGGEAIAGFLIGNLLGAAVGIGLWFDVKVADVARPYLVALGALPLFAIAPLTILWFGIGVWAKIDLAILATVFIAAAHAFKGVEEIEPLYLKRLRLMGAGRRMILRRLLLPSSTSWIVASLRITIGAALFGAFLGEFIASDKGLGHLIIKAGGLYDTPRVLTCVLAMVGIALGLDTVVSRVERRLIRWR